jgi:pantoate--beta-alanine ligase
MATDLRLASEIVVCPIVRHPDGLALSSRNVYLSQAERTQALVLGRAVHLVEALVAAGECRSSILLSAAALTLATVPEVRIDYMVLVDRSTLQPAEIATPGTLFAIAAWVGQTRLIDNAVVS